MGVERDRTEHPGEIGDDHQRQQLVDHAHAIERQDVAHEARTDEPLQTVEHCTVPLVNPFSLGRPMVWARVRSSGSEK